MKRITLTALYLCLCLYGFAQSSGQAVTGDNIQGRPLAAAFDNIHWITRPADKTITVVGIAGRKRSRDQAIADALADAARKVSLYYGVYGEATAILQEGSNLLDYFADTKYSLNITNRAELYIDGLVYDKEKDVYEKNGSVYVRARYSGVQDVPSYKSEVKNNVPDWVREYRAEIPGFMVGIGVAKNKGTLQKTCVASYENAIVSLLSRLSSKIEESILDVEGKGRITRNVTKSKGTLSAVMILETWFDKKTGSVWTLLVAKE
ncbi:MAG: hypothetical protein LBB72_05385 [Spirochaetaceae bacterium]|jgi:hypothetical protein|nr:hypothetical protein [Spirochaetaceae bacterium]